MSNYIEKVVDWKSSTLLILLDHAYKNQLYRPGIQLGGSAASQVQGPKFNPQ